MGRDPRDRRRTAGDEGNEVCQPQRSLDDGVDPVADLHIFPIARGGVTRLLGEYLFLDRDEFFLGPWMRDSNRAGRRALLHLTSLEAHPRADELGHQLIVLVFILLKDVLLSFGPSKP